jgi:hypothetical protein
MSNPTPAPVAEGNKTITAKIVLFTDDNPADSAQTSRQAWAQGYVQVPANGRHDIKSGTPVMFNRMADLPGAIEDALTEAGVTLRLTPCASRLYQ